MLILRVFELHFDACRVQTYFVHGSHFLGDTELCLVSLAPHIDEEKFSMKLRMLKESISCISYFTTWNVTQKQNKSSLCQKHNLPSVPETKIKLQVGE